MTPRDTVQWFSVKMENRLRKNDHKGGWDRENGDFLSDKLKEEFEEVQELLKKLNFDIILIKNKRTRTKLINECADLANIAMMIADNVAYVGD